LPPELQKEPSLQTFRDVGTMAKSYVEAQKLIGTKRVSVPGEKATDAEWESFYTNIGRPETADKYADVELKDENGKAISAKPDPKELGELKKFFHKMGLTGRQASQMQEYSLKYMLAQQTGAAAAKASQTEAGVTELKTEWGDKFDANVDVARSVVKKFGDAEVAKFLEDSGMGNNIPLIRFLNKVGVSILEDSGRRGTDTSLPMNDSTRATQEIDNLKTDAAFQKALGDPRDMGHDAAVRRWTRLFQVAHPGSQAEG